MKPCLLASPLSRPKVSSLPNDFGYSIDESLDALVKLINGITREDIDKKSYKALNLWERYKDATENYLTSKYAVYMQLK